MTQFFTNPLIVKEMRERFRSIRTMWVVSLYLLVMGAILFGFIYLDELQFNFVPGERRAVLVMISLIQYGLFCFIAPALSAGAISGERERQTLHILLATQLGHYKIVLSKLFTSLAFIVLLLIAALPLYSLVFLYGGVSPIQLLKLFAFFAINILFFGTLGLFCSTWAKRTGVSTICAYGIAFFFVVGTALLYLFLDGFIVQNFAVDPAQLVWMRILAGINPGFVLLELLGEEFYPFTLFGMNPWLFFTLTYLLFSTILIIWSGYLLNPLRRPLPFRWNLFARK